MDKKVLILVHIIFPIYNVISQYFFSPYLTEEYPNYWGTMPMPMFTVLEQINFEGKTVRPVCTHEGSGMGRSEADLKKCCPGAVIKKGLAIQGSSAGRCDTALKNWLEE